MSEPTIEAMLRARVEEMERVVREADRDVSVLHDHVNGVIDDANHRMRAHDLIWLIHDRLRALFAPPPPRASEPEGTSTHGPGCDWNEPERTG